MDWGVILGAVAAILGGWAQGHFWYRYEKRRAREADEKQQAAVRTMLHMEIDAYLEMLARTKTNTLEYLKVPAGISLTTAHGLGQVLPHLDPMIWGSQMPALPHAFASDELMSLLRFLRAAAAIHEECELFELAVQWRLEAVGSPESSNEEIASCERILEASLARVREAVDAVVKQGNPIAEPPVAP